MSVIHWVGGAGKNSAVAGDWSGNAAPGGAGTALMDLACSYSLVAPLSTVVLALGVQAQASVDITLGKSPAPGGLGAEGVAGTVAGENAPGFSVGAVFASPGWQVGWQGAGLAGGQAGAESVRIPLSAGLVSAQAGGVTDANQGTLRSASGQGIITTGRNNAGSDPITNAGVTQATRAGGLVPHGAALNAGGAIMANGAGAPANVASGSGSAGGALATAFLGVSQTTGDAPTDTTSGGVPTNAGLLQVDDSSSPTPHVATHDTGKMLEDATSPNSSNDMLLKSQTPTGHGRAHASDSANHRIHGGSGGLNLDDPLAGAARGALGIGNTGAAGPHAGDNASVNGSSLTTTPSDGGPFTFRVAGALAGSHFASSSDGKDGADVLLTKGAAALASSSGDLAAAGQHSMLAEYGSALTRGGAPIQHPVFAGAAMTDLTHRPDLLAFTHGNA